MKTSSSSTEVKSGNFATRSQEADIKSRDMMKNKQARGLKSVLSQQIWQSPKRIFLHTV